MACDTFLSVCVIWIPLVAFCAASPNLFQVLRVIIYGLFLAGLVSPSHPTLSNHPQDRPSTRVYRFMSCTPPECSGIMERCFRVLIVITRDWTDQGIVKNHTLCAYGMAMRASKVPMSEMRPYSPCFWNSATMPRPGHGARQNSSNVHSCTGAAYAWPRRKLRRGDPGLCRTLGRSSCPRRRPDGTHCEFWALKTTALYFWTGWRSISGTFFILGA